MSQASLSSINTTELTEEEKNLLVKKKFFSCTDCVYTDPCHCLVPPLYKERKEMVHQFQFRQKDVVLICYPKTGSTWMGEILWSMTSVNELHRAEEESILDRITYLHNDILRPVQENDDTVAARKFRSKFPGRDFKGGVWLNLAKTAPDRRVFKSHLPPPLLHPSLLEKAKVIATLRNPKDTCLSSYNFRQNSSPAPFHGDFFEFCDLFMGGPMPWGDYWNYVRQTWALKGHPNVHLVFYEDLKKNLMGELQKLNQFCEFNLSEDQLKRVAEHVDIENMRRREKIIPVLPSVKGTFFNSGKIGGWESVATPELDARMNKWIEEGAEGMDIKFSYQ